MRYKSIKNVLDKKFKVLQLQGMWRELLGEVEACGYWLISGQEKMGKTTLSVLLADYLSDYSKVLYVMAEQGLDLDFQTLLNRLSIGTKRKINFIEYIPLEELCALLKRRNQPEIIFIDNVTVYVDELRAERIRSLIREHPQKLFIFIAHTEDGKLYTAAARLIKKLAKRIINVEGNRATIQGRTEGGSIIINADKAQLYHGTTNNIL